MRHCSFDSCTFSITGRCIQGNSESDCPHIEEDSEQGEITELESGDDSWTRPTSQWQNDNDGSAGHAVLEPTKEIPRLPPSMTLGSEEAQILMCGEYTTMVGIVGLPASGKTACLVSAYLLLARGQFEGYSYADSQSLMAFEQIARGSRQWTTAETPRQMTVRTELADDRQAGFLHFKLRRKTDNRLFNILLPDLPGEWSRSLIDKADSTRFEFIKSATVIWIMVDGREFADPTKRNYATYRTELLITRLAEILDSPTPRIILVPSWRDIGEFPKVAFDQIQAVAEEAGFSITLAPVASFSDNDDVEPGEGVAELLNITLNHDRVCPDFWPDDHTSKLRNLSAFRSL
ncbi:TRAFAC clade GTPase domain-containing protein [Pseudomonas chlororaphis]|uniref:TRAFAC clade GTPase domain-containing protein n=1 Tax=Pseudomonas chlororaphis TaxID=587753 RepID=UPI00236649E1|nr:hypothetical protein [Pseudomonas chlororaphis]WDH19919.1 hypothetical protein PUP50_17900 [Pseudomonas chlororaphis]